MKFVLTHTLIITSILLVFIWINQQDPEDNRMDIRTQHNSKKKKSSPQPLQDISQLAPQGQAGNPTAENSSDVKDKQRKVLKLKETPKSKAFAKDKKYHDTISVRERFVELPQEIYELKAGESYRLQLFNDTHVDFKVRRKKPIVGKEKYSILGDIKDVDYGYVNMVFYNNRNTVAGNVNAPGKQPFKIQDMGHGVHRISERRIAKRNIPEVYQHRAEQKAKETKK